MNLDLLTCRSFQEHQGGPRSYVSPTRLNFWLRCPLAFKLKYLDGVHFLVSKIRTLFDEHGLPCEAHLEARPEGYYAAHLCVSCEFEIPAWRWDTVRTRVAVELQITTQVQDLIRRLLHRHYERRRSKPTPDVITWQWDYKSAEFVPNYLGHILHYVEGMIMEVREGRSERRRA